MSENKNAKTPTDSGVGFIDGVWHGPKAWQCQCGRPYTVTCISSKPSKQWVGLTDEDRNNLWRNIIGWGDPSHDDEDLMKAIEAKLQEKNA